jgi:hypothetical protein
MNDKTTRTDGTGAWIREGALGGLIAGIVMAMVAMMYTLFAQGDLLAPLKQMGATFFSAASASGISLLAGLMLHMVMSIILGIVFALFVAGRVSGYGPLVVAGFIYIAVEWAIARFVVLPVVDPPLITTFGAIGGIVAHMMYGIVLGAWLGWRFARHTLEARHREQALVPSSTRPL